MKARAAATAIGCGLALCASGLVSRPALSKKLRLPQLPLEFAMLEVPVPMQRLSGPPERTLTGTSIAATSGGLLVIDDETGTLSLLGRDGSPHDSAIVGSRAGLLAVDREAKVVFVADRSGDGIVVFRYGKTLTPLGRIATAPEPYGVALTPTGSTLLVSTRSNEHAPSH